jgi:hypothetical protein
LFFDNAANAEIYARRRDISLYAPYSVPETIVKLALFDLDTEVTEVTTLTDDVIGGSPLAYAQNFRVLKGPR